jgi:hypothetical protein
MNEDKQFQFIAVILLAFALSLAFVPVCHAQSEDSSRSDDTADSGSGDDMSSGEADTGSSEAYTGSDQTDTGSGAAKIDRSGLEIFQAAGPNPIPPEAPQSIQSTVDAFRAKLGEPNNGNNPGPISGGRREINWDGGGPPVANTTAPVTPFDVFLNTRGARSTTPGKGLSQATPDGLAVLFKNASYSFTFSTFSPLRLFTPKGSNITEVLFFLPGINPPPLPGDPSTPATVRGFGAVFTDVDRPDGSQVDNRRSRRASTFIEYYDAKDNLIFRGIVPPSPGSRNMSFFGIAFDKAIIARVRIITGNSAPGPDDGRRDIVMMDDFIYGEPQALP